MALRLLTPRLELRPLPAAVAVAVLEHRDIAERLLGVTLPPAWPLPDLLDVLPLQAASNGDMERYGVWVMIERATNGVVGDIGFMGPPNADGSLELGYSVIPDRRRRGYATEAARALAGWGVDQPGVTGIVAECDPDNTPSVLTLERSGFERVGQDGHRIRWAYGLAQARS